MNGPAETLAIKLDTAKVDVAGYGRFTKENLR